MCERLIFYGLSHIKGAGAYSELHMDDGKQHIHDKTLDKLLDILPSNFERIHKSYIVDLAKVCRLVRQTGSYYIAELLSGEQLPIGRTRIKEVKAKLLV